MYKVDQTVNLSNLYKSLKEIFSFKQRKEIYILLIFSIFAMLFEMLSIISIFPFLNYIFEGPENAKNFIFLSNYININQTNYLFTLIIFFVSIFFIKAVYLTFFIYRKNKFIYNVRTFQTQNLFHSYIRENYYFHIKTNSANLIRNLNDASLMSVFARSLVDLFAETIMFVGIIFFLLIISPKITLSLIVLFGIVGIVFYKFIQTKASEWGEQSKKFRGLKLKNMKESFGAIRDIKILGKEKNFLDIFSFNNLQENEFTKKNSFVSGLPKIWFEWLTVLSMVTLIVLLTQDLSDKTEIIPILGIFALAAYRIIPSISKISTYLQDIKFCLPAVQPFILDKKFLDNTNISNDIVEKKIFFNNQIEIEDLSFKFPGSNKNILENLNLKIKKGEFIGIYGRSGEGKTTLINLLLGLLRPNTGQICVDQKNIYDNLKGWQKKLSYIPQNVFITDDSIARNIALGENDNEINFDKLNRCLRVSNINDFIDSLPDGIRTNCGELGDRFSGGQKQRLGIARAFYINSEILIFDEFTNFLDADSEKKILEEVKLLKGQKTIVMISHKISTLSYSDKLYKLEDKKLKI